MSDKASSPACCIIGGGGRLGEEGGGTKTTASKLMRYIQYNNVYIHTHIYTQLLYCIYHINLEAVVFVNPPPPTRRPQNKIIQIKGSNSIFTGSMWNCQKFEQVGLVHFNLVQNKQNPKDCPWRNYYLCTFISIFILIVYLNNQC